MVERLCKRLILSDRDIKDCINRGLIEVDPFIPEYIQPASLDLTLGDEFIFYNTKHKVFFNGTLEVAPKEFFLATTSERIKLPNTLCAQLDGRSSIGRLGIAVHITAGYIDPGFEGQITLEIFNCSDKPVKLEVGCRICQLIFHKLSSPCKRPYQGKYQNQKGVVASLFSKDKEVNI